MIVVENLVKRYGAREAVRGLSFTVEKGEIVGFLGPNGAGKSTTLRILAGYLAPTSGRARVCGIDVEEDPLGAKEKVGYMPETVPLYPEMRVIEYLSFRAELKGVARKLRRSRVDDVIDKARVSEVAHVVIGHLSKGYRQRVGLADALVADPPLLVLDEPTAGLDPNQIREVREVISDLRGSHTVLVSTHILSEVEASCTRAVVIAKGKLLAEGTLESLKDERVARGLTVRIEGPRDAMHALLTTARSFLPPLRKDPELTEGGDTCAARLEWGRIDEDTSRKARAALAKLAVDRGLSLLELEPLRGRLEDVFVELTRGPGSGESPSEDEAAQADEGAAS
jgi:ABC-2 type transport system ATP-binding protein